MPLFVKDSLHEANPKELDCLRTAAIWQEARDLDLSGTRPRYSLWKTNVLQMPVISFAYPNVWNEQNLDKPQDYKIEWSNPLLEN